MKIKPNEARQAASTSTTLTSNPFFRTLPRVWPRNYFEVGPQLNQSDSSSEYCVHYYPQLFTGRWISLDTALTRREMAEERRVETPTPLPSEIRRWINQKDRPVFRGN